MRLRSEPVLSDVVRARIEALLADVTPRRASGESPPHERVPEPARTPAAPEPPVEADPDLTEQPEWRLSLRTAWAFGRSHLLVVGIIAVAGLAWSGWTLASARTVPVPVASAPATPVLTPAPSASPTPPPTVKVHVLGAVGSPGVVSLPVGARVEDALAAAGGLTMDARPGDLNLAAPLTDGAQLLVGDASRPTQTSAPASGGTAAGASGALLDLNSATAAQLEELPGVGPVTAAAILTWRSAHGSFSSVEELQEVDGIGPRTYAQLAPLVRV